MGNQQVCGCYQNQELKNYRRARRDTSAMQNKFFVFGVDKKNISFMYFYDMKRQKLINLDIKTQMWNFSGSVMTSPNHFFICGGVNFGMNLISNSAMLYSIREHQFKMLPVMKNLRFNFPSIHVNGRVYVMGGRRYGYDETAILRECEYFELETGKWHSMAPMHVKRCGHQLFLYDEKIYVIGGLTLEKMGKNLEYYDLVLDEWVLTTLRLHFNLFNFEIYSKDHHEILLIGGFHRLGISNFVHSLNLESKTVRSEGFLTMKRAHLKLFFDKANNKLVIFGGLTSRDPLLSNRYAESYDLITRTSSTISVDSNSQLAFIQKYNYNRTVCSVKSVLPEMPSDAEIFLQ